MSTKYNSNCISWWLRNSLFLLAAVMLPNIATGATPAFPGDLNGDGGVTWDDMGLFSASWLVSDCNDSLDADCDVDFEDYAILALDWLKGLPEFRGIIYYVATDGNDLNPGTVSSPWATIQKAAGTMVAGDTVIVRPGTYYGLVTVANSGNSQGCGLGDSPITYLAESPGSVILDATGSSYGFRASTKAWIIIDGFKVTGASADGIRFDTTDGLSYNVIRNCQAYGNSDGIEISTRDKVTIENCLLYGNTSAGIRTNLSSTLRVNKCVMYGNVYGVYLSGDSLVKDCIITNNTTAGVQASSSHIIEYCDVWNNVTNYNGGASAGTGCINADPCFVNPVTDFHLLAGSPAIGAASDSSNMGRKDPKAEAGPDQTYYANELATFDGSASKGNIVSYVWDFNDTDTGSGKIVTHTYTTAGTYTVSLDVNDGNSTDIDTCTIQILPSRAPEVVYHVTNLSNSGAGSFTYCLSQANSDGVPSRIVFDVNGPIVPTSNFTLSEPNTTICGTEAPGNGITFDFGGNVANAFVINGNNCRMCNIIVTNTETNTDGIQLRGNNDILERVTTTWCRDEGVSVYEGYGHIVAFCRIEYCGSQPGDGSGDDDGRGISVWSGVEATVVGNCIKDNLRGALVQNGFGDFRNNLVTYNHQTFGLNVQGVSAYANFISNTISNNGGYGIRYMDGATFYRGNPNTNIFIPTVSENFVPPTYEVYTPITRPNTPYPKWLENVFTPTSVTNTGKGSGPCQCVLCE